MPVLTLDYRHCKRKRPSFLKNSEIERVAALARQQLVGDATDAVHLAVLSGISGLKINGIVFDLFVGTGDVVHDEDGTPVLGVCEYDPGAPNTAMVPVSPAGEHASEALVLSTLGHEMGHAVFDAPGWIVDASKGPGLFDDPSESAHRCYRMTTKDGEHLSKVVSSGEEDAKSPASVPGHTSKELYFAELRANEFMGSLLVPRQRLNLAVEELASKYEVTIRRAPSLDPELPGQSMYLTADGDMGFFDMESLQKALATRFGVNRRFIAVRMERYGLLRPEAKPR